MLPLSPDERNNLGLSIIATARHRSLRLSMQNWMQLAVDTFACAALGDKSETHSVREDGMGAAIGGSNEGFGLGITRLDSSKARDIRLDLVKSIGRL